MTEDIIIQRVNSTYQEQVLDLILNIQQNEYHLPITREDQPDLLNIDEFYQRDQGNFWIAVDQGQVIGTIALLDIGGDQAALRKMFVAESHRGRHHQVSGRLLDQAFQWANEHSLTDIYLGTTERFVAAHRFYEKNEFVPVSRDNLPVGFPVMKVDTRFYHKAAPFR